MNQEGNLITASCYKKMSTFTMNITSIIMFISLVLQVYFFQNLRTL